MEKKKYLEKKMKRGKQKYLKKQQLIVGEIEML